MLFEEFSKEIMAQGEVETLPNGGFIIRQNNRRFHTVLSGVPAEMDSSFILGLKNVNQNLAVIFEANYAQYLKSFNGGLFYFDHIYLHGFSAPKLINSSDGAYYPSSIIQSNYHDRPAYMTENFLIIGGDHVSEKLITIDISGNIFFSDRNEDSKTHMGTDLYQIILDYQLPVES